MEPLARPGQNCWKVPGTGSLVISGTAIWYPPFFFFKFIFERETEREQGRGRERETQNPKQAPDS